MRQKFIKKCAKYFINKIRQLLQNATLITKCVGTLNKENSTQFLVLIA